MDLSRVSHRRPLKRLSERNRGAIIILEVSVHIEKALPDDFGRGLFICSFILEAPHE
jgi:hypothetical protein